MQQLSLSEFNSLLKAAIKDHLEPSYWIVAEIGELNHHSSGHCYLTLVEKKGQKVLAKIRATIWSFTFSNIQTTFFRVTGMPLEAGMTVLLNAVPEFHEVYGLSLNVREIDPNYTLGERERARQETIAKLEREGLLELNKQIPLPTVAQKIAVISSATAAGFGDFTNQLENNPYGYKAQLKLYSATMQGDAAAESIMTAITSIEASGQEFDLLVIIRGGGAKTDLDCFDDYELCKKIAECRLPVVTGIGHERDETIADMVANTRLKTPTAVAEFILSAMLHFESEMQLMLERITRVSIELINWEKNSLTQLMSDIPSRVSQRLLHSRFRLESFERIIERRPKEIIDHSKLNLKMMAKLIDNSSLDKALSRGFTVTKVNGKYLKDETSINPGDKIETQYSQGTFTSTVDG